MSLSQIILVLLTTPRSRSPSCNTFNFCLILVLIPEAARLMIVDNDRVFTRLLTPFGLIRRIGYVFVCKKSSFYQQTPTAGQQAVSPSILVGF